MFCVVHMRKKGRAGENKKVEVEENLAKAFGGNLTEAPASN